MTIDRQLESGPLTRISVKAIQDRLREMARDILTNNTADHQKAAAFHMHNALNTAAIHIGKEFKDGCR
jgi:hypothetical protein